MEMIRKLKNKKGFTLVELIVVIVIIAILAAVAVPLLTKYIGNAKDSAKAATVSVVETAANTAVTAVSGGITTNTVVQEMEGILGTKYTVTGTATTITVASVAKPTEIVTVTGTGLDSTTAVITGVTGW